MLDEAIHLAYLLNMSGLSPYLHEHVQMQMGDGAGDEREHRRIPVVVPLIRFSA
jgi:hypothetical protein